MNTTPGSWLDAERRERFSVENVTGATVEILFVVVVVVEILVRAFV